MQCAKRLRKEWSQMDATLKFNLRAAIKVTNHKRSFERFSYCDWPLLFAGISTRTQEPIFGKQKACDKACTDSLVCKRPRATIQRIYAQRIPGYSTFILSFEQTALIQNFQNIGMFVFSFQFTAFICLKRLVIFGCSFLQFSWEDVWTGIGWKQTAMCSILGWLLCLCSEEWP